MMNNIATSLRSIAADVRDLGRADTLIWRWWCGTSQAERTARELEELAVCVEADIARLKHEIARRDKALDGILENAQADADEADGRVFAMRNAECSGRLARIYERRDGQIVRTHFPRCWLRDLAKETAL